jgi:hypothetical protein
MGKLIVDPEELVKIRALVAAAERDRRARALPEAERLAAGVLEMPSNVRWFFESADAVPPHRWESDEDREDRQWRASLGGWPGG